MRLPVSSWLLLSGWLALSLAGLAWFEYQDALRGVLCMTGSS